MGMKMQRFRVAKDKIGQNGAGLERIRQGVEKLHLRLADTNPFLP